MRFSGYKTKAFFTLGIYVYFWHHNVVNWMRDELRVPVSEQETWRLFIPVYNWVVWWRYLASIRNAEFLTFGSADLARGMKPLSVGRAFFWSSLWFQSGPYVNRHLNALDAYRRGVASSALPPPPREAVAS